MQVRKDHLHCTEDVELHANYKRLFHPKRLTRHPSQAPQARTTIASERILYGVCTLEKLLDTTTSCHMCKAAVQGAQARKWLGKGTRQ